MSATAVPAAADAFAVVRDNARNKGNGFSEAERTALGLRGLLPPGHHSLEQQVELVMTALSRISNDLSKFEYLLHLRDSNERLFFAACLAHTETVMPLVYTPVVGAACQSWSRLLLPTGRGLYISLEHGGHVADVLARWPAKEVKVIVVTDGERILGLGDLGVNGMGIPMGKLALYTALAGIDPALTLPVTLDVGTNNKELLADPFYLGLRQPREPEAARAAPGSASWSLVTEFITAVQARWGKDTLIQFEDFGNATAFPLLHHWADKATCFNDDIQGTASVVLAGLLSAVHLQRMKLSESTFVFLGAGEAGCGIAELVAYAITQEAHNEEGQGSGGKMSMEEARKRIWLVDTKGLVTCTRGDGASLAHHKQPFAHEHPAVHVAPGSGEVGAEAALIEVIKTLHPNALIGVSAQGGAFTKGVVHAMCASMVQRSSSAGAGGAADHAAAPAPAPAAAAAATAAAPGHYYPPIIFSLSNPTSKSECTAEQAYKWSLEAAAALHVPVPQPALFASGSPFAPVPLEGRLTQVPGQANNAFIFPAFGLATIAVRMQRVPQQLFYTAAVELSKQVGPAELACGNLMPPIVNIRDVSARVAAAVAAAAYDLGVAALSPRPSDLLAHMKATMWSPYY